MSWQVPLRGSHLELGARTLVMGILNVTPDSFSDGGRFLDLERALVHAREMVAQGADILDVGGESTRPGHEVVPVQEELRRVVPVVEALLRELPGTLISVDTTKPAVAEASLGLGAHILNDQWGLQGDPEMLQVAARHEVPVVCMHNGHGNQYTDIMQEMLVFFRRTLALAAQHGIDAARIIIDPGIGFAKTWQQNLEVMGRMRELAQLGRPLLLGTSRKSFIGKVLDLQVHERVEGTAATVSVGIMHGAEIVRVHDVQQMTRVARMTDAMVRPWRQPAGLEVLS